MGRGGRSTRTLALNPLVPSPTLAWRDALIEVEEKYYHGPASPACNIPYPSGVPRFVVIDEVYDSATLDVHTFRYYTTPEALLSALLPALRTPAQSYSHLMEYRPDTSTFEPVKLDVEIRGYAPAQVTSNRRARSKRARAIIAAYSPPAKNNYTGQGRFLAAMLNRNGEVQLYGGALLKVVERAAATLATAPLAFLDLYDLAISERSIPIRFVLRYTSANGDVHEMAEAI